MSSEIKITIPLRSDSDNYIAETEITFQVISDEIFIKLSGSDREVSISRENFDALVYIVNAPTNKITLS